jgi:hypothetical protein
MAYFASNKHFYETFQDHVEKMSLGSYLTSEDIINQYGISKSYFYACVGKLIDEGLLERGVGREEEGSSNFAWAGRPTFKRYYRIDPITGLREKSKPEPEWAMAPVKKSTPRLTKLTFEFEVDGQEDAFVVSPGDSIFDVLVKSFVPR